MGVEGVLVRGLITGGDDRPGGVFGRDGEIRTVWVRNSLEGGTSLCGLKTCEKRRGFFALGLVGVSCRLLPLINNTGLPSGALGSFSIGTFFFFLDFSFGC